MDTSQGQQPEEIEQDQIASYHDDMRQFELDGYETGVRKARNALFAAGGIILVWQIIAVAMTPGAEFSPELFLLIAPFVIGFVVLGFLTKKKPYTSIIIGICLFFLYWALIVIINVMYGEGMDIFKAIIGGWWVKLLILINLFRPLKDAKELQRAKDEKKF
jgi:hypothetical protein